MRTYTAYVMLKCIVGSEGNLIKEICKLPSHIVPDVRYCQGVYDIVVKIVGITAEEMNNYIKKVKGMNGIDSSITMLAVNGSYGRS